MSYVKNLLRSLMFLLFGLAIIYGVVTVYFKYVISDEISYEIVPLEELLMEDEELVPEEGTDAEINQIETESENTTEEEGDE
jgi:hypothetical protein